jgi:hypothetical protein
VPALASTRFATPDRNRRPSATRLNRIEDLLIEMRGVLDFHLKRIAALQKQVDILIERDRVRL